tara:strand:+ start:484 stop:819 length:336 start_codon:yes stop_codon:yes gene_type:complete
MENIIHLFQITVATSVAYVWIFRFHNVLKEFELFQLSDLIRNFVGVSKISLATLIIVSIWYPSLTLIPSLLMGGFMLSAQFFHFKVNNPFIKHLPSLLLLILCSVIAYSSF